MSNAILDSEKPADTETLVDLAFGHRAEIAWRKIELEKLEALIIARGPGKHTGTIPENVAQVIAAVPAGTGPDSYALDAEREERAEQLAGGSFPKLFTRVVSYVPVAGFADVARALLTPAKWRKIVDLCRVPGRAIPGKRAYVKYP
jgi:hypothetical protein